MCLSEIREVFSSPLHNIRKNLSNRSEWVYFGSTPQPGTETNKGLSGFPTKNVIMTDTGWG